MIFSVAAKLKALVRTLFEVGAWMQNKAMSCCEAPGNVFSSDFPSDD